jgi:hypothetical protein
MDERSDLTYDYKPAAMGAPWQFRLAPEALEWSLGRHSGRAPYGSITRVRLSFRPVSLQSYRFLAEIWPRGGPKLVVASTTWRSMVAQERQDAAYAAFIDELHRRVVAAGGQGAFITGSPALLYWSGVAIFLAASLALAALTARAVAAEAWTAGAMIAGFFGLFLWQLGGFFRRNRPGRYRPDALPPALLP